MKAYTLMPWSKFGHVAAVVGCFILPLAARANISFSVDAGYIQPTASSSTPFNTTTGGGGLLMLVDTGTSLPTTVAPGTSFLNPGETLIAAFGANASGFGGTSGTGVETVNVFNNFNFPSGAVTGDYLELRWFPTVTLSQYGTATYTSSTPLGVYNPLLYPSVNGTKLNPDGGSPWTVPTNGASGLQYLFITSDNGGTQPAIEGYAVPEPSTYGLCGGFLGVLLCVRSWLARTKGSLTLV